MSKPTVAVLLADGINCDAEMAFGFERASADVERVHVNQLVSREKRLGDFAILALPGGFSYGDDIASGAVLGNELRTQLDEDLSRFVDDKKPVIGVCNGFQTLVRMGLLPDGKGQQTATLAENSNGSFLCKWVELEVGANVCSFTDGLENLGDPLPMQIAHREGRFTASEHTLRRLDKSGQIAFRYRNNPNGSALDIAGICNPHGNILGMMPHPERSIDGFHPDRRQTARAREVAETIFDNIVTYARES